MRPIRTPRDLGATIRAARRERGLSQAELAAAAGVGRPWLSELEGGKRTAEVGLVLAVIGALDLELTLASTPPPSMDLDAILRSTSS